MASKSVVDAVMARLSSNWSGAPVFGANEQYEAPRDGSVFVRVDWPISNSEQASFGAPGQNVWRDEGVFRLVIHAQRGVGIDAGLTMADELAALFRGKEFSGVQTFAPSAPATDDDSGNGNYYILAVAVPYQFDLIG